MWPSESPVNAAKEYRSHYFAKNIQKYQNHIVLFQEMCVEGSTCSHNLDSEWIHMHKLGQCSACTIQTKGRRNEMRQEITVPLCLPKKIPQTNNKIHHWYRYSSFTRVMGMQGKERKQEIMKTRQLDIIHFGRSYLRLWCNTYDDNNAQVTKQLNLTRMRDASGDNGFPSSQTTKSETSSTTPAIYNLFIIDKSTFTYAFEPYLEEKGKRDTIMYLYLTGQACLASVGMAPSHVWTAPKDLLWVPPETI